MKILITGASGFIGGRLRSALQGRGHALRLAGRRPPSGLASDEEWVSLDLARPALDGVDVEQPHNDLQIAAVDLEPEAGRALGLLRAAGATEALLSGSGPGAFGLFEDPAAAAKALAGGWRGLTAAFESAPAGYAEVRAAS